MQKCNTPIIIKNIKVLAKLQNKNFKDLHNALKIFVVSLTIDDAQNICRNKNTGNVSMQRYIHLASLTISSLGKEFINPSITSGEFVFTDAKNSLVGIFNFPIKLTPM
ncbi:hypothetical protein IJ732_07355 [bacterium]|nr:hypothetical protein [bacterium]